MDEDLEKIKKAGRIAAESLSYGKTLIKEGASVKEIIEKIEKKIASLNGKPAFPPQISINEVAAHFIPDTDLVLNEGNLIRIDLGAHIDGFIADTAMTVEVKTNNNKELIAASSEALDNAIKIINKDTKIYEVGKVIEETIKKFNFKPITNLSGHSINTYNLHSGLTIPNYNNNNQNKLGNCLIAIEPFATNGIGLVQEGKSSNVYKLVNIKPVRDKNTRLILEFIEKEYSTLPFSKFWLIKKFGSISSYAINILERENILYSYPQLVEKGKGLVSQAEHTVYIGDKVIVTTKRD